MRKIKVNPELVPEDTITFEEALCPVCWGKECLLVSSVQVTGGRWYTRKTKGWSDNMSFGMGVDIWIIACCDFPNGPLVAQVTQYARSMSHEGRIAYRHIQVCDMIEGLLNRSP